MATQRAAATSLKGERDLSLDTLRGKIADYLPPEQQETVARAYTVAEKAHAGQVRRSGEPYIMHPLAAACLVADLHMDAPTVCGALLHDVVEDCDVTLEQIEAQFGPEVRRMVDGVTKLNRLDLVELGEKGRSPTQADDQRKMLLAMAEDIRVVIIKLADRLHNMRTLSALSPARQVANARETMEIYAPLASRLGIWNFKWELEDLSFRYLQPDDYKSIAKMLDSTRATREGYIHQAVTVLQTEMDASGIKGDVSGRPKHIYSIYNKTHAYAGQGRSVNEIYDILALRVLVPTVNDCYTTLGVVHNLWKPLPGTFDDYISMPKESGYQSLHTTVIAVGGKPLEVQIRTQEMHRVAEYGVAAHWRYKEGAPGGKRGPELDERLSWLRQLLEWQREMGGEEFMESVKTDIFSDRVFVFTPKGDIKDLPAGATPLDFAYRIHTDLGHRCIGAKVGGRLVPLNQSLRTGDVVEIVAGKGERAPRLDWLNADLGYVRTAQAREKVRAWFRHVERAESVDQGRYLLKRELARFGLTAGDAEIAKLLKYDTVDDLYEAVGTGDLTGAAIASKMAAQEEKERPPQLPTNTAPATPPPAKGLRVMGVGDLLTRLASCCHPVLGDEIIGYITRSRGVTVHRQDCPNIIHEDERERLISVEWGGNSGLYSVPVRISAIDRVGLLRDIASMVSSEGINILQTYQAAQSDGTAMFQFTMEIAGMSQLSRIVAKLESISGVSTVARITDGSVPA